MSDAVLRPLDPTSAADLGEASRLLAAALPLDGVAVVAAEKLFAGNGRRRGSTFGLFSPGGELLGVLAQAGRWVKLLAVSPAWRRRGIATRLLAEARRNLDAETAAAGTGRLKLRLGDHAGNYLSPGIDVRYQDGQAFFQRRGFAEVATTQNLRAPLAANPAISDDRLGSLGDKAQGRGYTVRRATAADREGLSAMVAQAFSPIWAFEVERALGPGPGGPAADRTPALPEGAAVHVAFDGSGSPVAFAAHDGNNRGLGWFGPMGTLDAHRGHGLGELLLLRCLRDVADGGRPDGGVIAWVGPAEFYGRTCGAVPDRRFVVYEES